MTPEKEKPEGLKYAFRILAIRPRTFFEMKQKLKKRGFEEKIIQFIIRELKRQGFLNDKKFAEVWIKEKINWHPCGQMLIRKKLQEKGIDYEIIENCLGKFLPPAKEMELAKKILKDKEEELKKEDLPEEKIYQKLGMFLKGKGFGGEVIIEVLQKNK